MEGVKGQPTLLSRYVSIGGDTDDTDLADFYAAGDESYPDIELKPEDPFCMTYTGGTTGRPKGVLCSHLNRYITAHTVAMEDDPSEDETSEVTRTA